MALVVSLLLVPSGFAAMARSATAGDWSGVVIGGGLVLPEYEGSADYRFLPSAYLSLKHGPFGVEIRGPRLQASYTLADIVTAGGIVAYAGTRDALAAVAAPEVGDTVMAGGFAALNFKPKALPSDSLVFKVEALTDAGGVFDGGTLTPSVNYSFMAGRAVRLSFGASATFADDSYMSAYFGAAGFSPGGGLKNIGLSSSATVFFTHHWGITAYGNWSRLVGDAADSPVTEARDQFVGGAGLTYKF